MHVSPGQIQKARTADLHQFLIMNHPDQFRREGISIRMIGNEGVSVRNGYYGYRNFATGDKGNGIDFLMKYLGYSFQEAVIALAGNIAGDDFGTTSWISTKREKPLGSLSLPEPAPLPHSRMYAYLINRGIPKQIVSFLATSQLIYQSAGTNNIVFVNKEKDYCELRGTYTFTRKPFHGCMKSKPDRFWYFKEYASSPDRAYVTEAAIDSISLYLIQKANGANTEKTVYISIGGVSNEQALQRIKRGIRTILAVDNDKAGQMCRDRHSELEYILPIKKDWNEDLQLLYADQIARGQHR